MATFKLFICYGFCNIGANSVVRVLSKISFVDFLNVHSDMWRNGSHVSPTQREDTSDQVIMSGGLPSNGFDIG